MICMLVSNSNLKSVMIFPPSEIARFPSLESLVVHHLRINLVDFTLVVSQANGLL